MKRFLLAICIGLFCLTAVFTQNNEAISKEPDSIPDIDSTFAYKSNQTGDKFMNINLNVFLPVRPTKLTLGGAGGIAFGVFTTDNLSFGGELSFTYSGTIAKNVFYVIPILINGSYQFAIDKFEFPIMLSLGGALQSYIDRYYFGFTARASVGAYYRLSSEWSIGLTGSVSILPQIYENSDYNYFGVLTTAGFAVRYHF